MMQPKHVTPHPKQTQMYGGGIPTKNISAATRVAQPVTRHHIALAAKQDHGQRAAHRSGAAPMPTQVTLCSTERG